MYVLHLEILIIILQEFYISEDKYNGNIKTDNAIENHLLNGSQFDQKPFLPYRQKANSSQLMVLN